MFECSISVGVYCFITSTHICQVCCCRLRQIKVVVCLSDEPVHAGPDCDQQCGADYEVITLGFNCHSSVCILKGARLLKLQHVKSNLYSMHLL